MCFSDAAITSSPAKKRRSAGAIVTTAPTPRRLRSGHGIGRTSSHSADQSTPRTRRYRTRSVEPLVEWFGINQRRVDAIVSAAEEQFRLVYFSDDGLRASSVSLYRRPPPFDGVAGGCAIVVNGPSGAGKSSVLAALAEASELPWIIFDEPVLGAVRQPYLIWRDRAPVLHQGFVAAIAALAREGNVVAFAAGGHPAGAIDEAFEGVRLVRVGLDCTSERCWSASKAGTVAGVAWSQPRWTSTTAGATTCGSTPPRGRPRASPPTSCASSTRTPDGRPGTERVEGSGNLQRCMSPTSSG